MTADDLRASKKAGFVDGLVETGDADADRERVVFERAAGRLKAVRVL